MQIIIYDTEFTAWKGSARRGWSADWEFKEIIQISAQKITLHSSSITINDSFTSFVQPTKNSNLSDYIINLTGIQQTNVNKGISSLELFQELEAFTDTGQIPMFSWGNDFHALHETAQLNSTNINWLNSYNLIPVFEGFGINTSVTSGMLYREFNLPLSLHEHDALDDTTSLVESLKTLYKSHPEQVFNTLKNLLRS